MTSSPPNAWVSEDVRPLSEIRVLECGDTLAAAYAGRLLSDLGADVVKAERPAGDPLRALGPFVSGAADPDLSVSFAYFNAGKQSVCADDGPAGERLLGELAAESDVLVRSTRDGTDWLPDDLVERLVGGHPGLIVCDISTFGRQGGGAVHPMSDLLALAASGFLSLSTTDPIDPAATPLRYRGELASVYAGTSSVVAVLAALMQRRARGAGQRIDVSAQAAVAGILGTGVSKFAYQGQVPVRDGTRTVAPWGSHRCRDGFVVIQCAEDQQWEGLLHALGDPAWGALEIFGSTPQRAKATNLVSTYVDRALAELSVAEFVTRAVAHQVPAAPIHSGADLLTWAHLAERHYFTPLALSDGAREFTVPAPSPPWRYGHTPAPPRRSSPRLRPADPDTTPRWPPPVRTASAPPPANPDDHWDAPLSGLRVLDLTWAWAGPYATLLLAHLGAEVIKVESAGRSDVTRRLGPYADDIAGPNRSGYFNQYNQGKKSITLNLKDPDGLAILKRLVTKSDVVIDNLRAGTLDRMGLPYETIIELNPRIVAVSITGFGQTGPERNRLAYGSIIDALSGAAATNGPVDGGPTDFSMAQPDPTAGMHAAVATLAAVYRAQSAGRGEHVEFSMLEASLSAFPWPVLFAAVSGQEAPVLGNRDDLRCPHDVYPCLGTDRWVAVAVDTDQQFAALATAIGRPELVDDPEFNTFDARHRHQDELDQILTTWTSRIDAEEAAATLRAAGVPAEAVATVDEIFRSRPLLDRHFFTAAPHPEVGIRHLPGAAWASSRAPMTATAAAPLLGQHTRTILHEILGLTDDELDQLERQGALR